MSMFFFVSEPSFDRCGSGSASFAVGTATIRCASMSAAIELSQRLRAVLQALARRGVRPRRRPGGLATAADLANWIDDLVSLSTDAGSLSNFVPSVPAARDDFETPK